MFKSNQIAGHCTIDFNQTFGDCLMEPVLFCFFKYNLGLLTPRPIIPSNRVEGGVQKENVVRIGLKK